MKKIGNFESDLKSCYWLLIILLTTSLPFNNIISSYITVGIAIIFIAIAFTIEKVPFNNFIILSLLLFSFHLSDLLLHFDDPKSIFFFEKQLSLISYPILISFTTKIHPQKVHLIYKFYSSTVLIAILFCFAYLCIQYLLYDKFLFYYSSQLQILSVHPAYMAIFVAISFFMITELIHDLNLTPLRSQLLISILFIFFLGILIFIKARTPIIAFIVSYIIWLFFNPINKGFRKSYFVVLACSLCLALILIFGNRFIKYRFTRSIKSGFEQRVTLWKSSLEVIKNNDSLFGYGNIEGAKKVIEKYQEKDIESLHGKNYNPHNQYLTYGIEYGVIGLFLFILYLFYLILQATRAGDPVWLSTLILYLVFFITESALERQAGIIPFMFFNSIFYYKNKY